MAAWPAAYGNFTFVQPPVLAGSSARLDILSAAFAAPDLAYGPLWVQLDAPDVQTLEAANLQLIFLFADSTGKYNTQLAVPPIFNDQATSTWISQLFRNPHRPQGLIPQQQRLLLRGSQPIRATAVRNSVALQSVRSLNRAEDHSHTNRRHSRRRLRHRLRNLLRPNQLRANIPTGTIDGTVQFTSSAGLPIAPLVIRLAGNSISTFEVTPLRPFIPPVE